MSQTITKSIGQGFAKNPIYAALAYDATDRFGGYQIKDVMHNTTYKVYFRNTTTYINSSADGTLALVGTTIAITGNATVSGTLIVTGALSYGSVSVPLAQTVTGTLTVGTSGGGKDVLFYGDTATYQWLWDTSANGVVMKGTWTCVGALTITGAVGITGDVTMATADQINFRTSSIYIQSGDAGHLDLVANTAIDITATTVAITGIAAVAGTITSTGKITVSPTAAGTFLDFALEDEWVSGTLIDADFGSAVTVNNDVIGIMLDFNSNVTMTTAKDVRGYQILLPALSQTAANTCEIIGFDLPTAGALVQSSGAGTISWRGLNIQLPNTTQTTGTVTAYGLMVTGGTENSGTQSGVYITGTITNGVELLGTITNFINFNSVGSTATTALHFKDAYLGMVIETGTYASEHSKGITLDSTNCKPVSFLFDDNDAALGYQNYRPVLSRVFLDANQDQGICLHCLRGQLVTKASVDLEIQENFWNAMDAVDGYLQFLGATTIGAKTRVSCVHATMQLTGNITVTSGGRLAGFFAEMSAITGATCTSPYPVAFLVDKLDSLHIASQRTWQTGIYIYDSSCVSGIHVGACTTGINITGAQTNALVITTTGSTSTIGTCLAIGTTGTPITSATTASMAMKLYSDYSKTTGYHMAMYVETRYTPVGTGTVRGIVGVADMTATQTSQTTTQYIVGVHGRGKISGTAYNSGLFVTGVHAQILDGGTWTAANHVSALWVDWQLNSNLSGISHSELVYITNNANDGTAANNPENVFYISSPMVDYFITFLSGSATGTNVGATASGGETRSYRLKCRYGSTDFYISGYTD